MGYRPGDRVTRQVELGKPERKAGVIIDKYLSAQSSQSAPFTLYSVRWDDSHKIERGYIAERLERE
jgi:hypothetical protein